MGKGDEGDWWPKTPPKDGLRSSRASPDSEITAGEELMLGFGCNLESVLIENEIGGTKLPFRSQSAPIPRESSADGS